jgi:hypothetical protein
LQVEGAIVGDVVLIEGLSVLGDDDIALVRGDSGDDARAIAPQVFFAFFGRPIGLFLVRRALDAHATIGVACGLTILAEAVAHRLAGIVLLHPGIEMLHIHGDVFAQARNFLLQRMDATVEQVLQQSVIERLLEVAQPALTTKAPFKQSR